MTSYQPNFNTKREKEREKRRNIELNLWRVIYVRFYLRSKFKIC